MAKTFFRKAPKKTPPAPAPEPTSSEADPEQASAPASEPSPEKAPAPVLLQTWDGARVKAPVPRHAPRLYDDTDVCRVLGLRRRVLVQHRATSKRGIDWGVCGSHAGMSAKWIREWNSKADLKRVKPLQPGDGITTVRVVGHVQNTGVIVAARVSDGTRVMVRVLDARYLHRGDEMDCRTVGGMLSYAPELNRERY